MKVLLISSSSGSRGGGELYWVRLANALSSLGCHVQVALSQHSRMDELASMFANPIQVHRWDFRNTYDRRLRVFHPLSRAATDKLKFNITKCEPDVIHINKQNIEDGLDIVRSASATGIPTLATIHITRSMHGLNAFMGRMRDAWTKRLLRRTSAHYLATARQGKHDLGNLLGREYFDRLHVVINGVETPSLADRDALRNEWRLQPTDVVVGCIARLEEQKRPLLALEMIADLPANVKLVWVGDGRLGAAMRAGIKARDLSDRVWLDGWRNDASSRLAGFDIFLLPSAYEGLPFAALEAMASGLPCVLSAVDGTREVLVDGESGFLCPATDVECWKKRLRQLTEDAQLRVRMGAAAKARQRSHFSIERMASQTLDVYERVMMQNAYEANKELNVAGHGLTPGR